MPSSRLLVFFLIAGCATGTEVPVAKNPDINFADHLSQCEDSQNALACARYGYLKKDLSYTRQACSLGHEDSCFNVREVERRAPNQNFALIAANQNQVYGCYVNHSIDVDNGENAKLEKVVDLQFHINTLGKISRLEVTGENLSEKFKACVVDSFSAKKFVPADRDQNIHYGFTMPSVTRDRRMKQKTPGIFD